MTYLFVQPLRYLFFPDGYLPTYLSACVSPSKNQYPSISILVRFLSRQFPFRRSVPNLPLPSLLTHPSPNSGEKHQINRYHWVGLDMVESSGQCTVQSLLVRTKVSAVIPHVPGWTRMKKSVYCTSPLGSRWGCVQTRRRDVIPDIHFPSSTT